MTIFVVCSNRCRTAKIKILNENEKVPIKSRDQGGNGGLEISWDSDETSRDFKGYSPLRVPNSTVSPLHTMFKKTNQ